MAGRKKNLNATFTKDGYEYHEGFLIRRIETTAGIRFQVDFCKKSGKYERLSFKTKDKARGCAAQRRVEIEKHGIDAKNLPQDKRIDALMALDALKDFDTNLFQAAKFYAKHHKTVDSRNGINHLIDAYLKEKAQAVKDGTLRPRTYEDVTKRLKPLGKQLGHLAIDVVEVDDIKKMLSGYKPRNASNYKRHASMFFRWAMKRDLVQGNPVEKLDAIKINDDAPKIYTPKQVKAILKACTDGDKLQKRMLPYLSLAFFAGIRPDEILRLDWKDVDLEDGIITILSDVSKTKKSRYIEMPNNLRQWIATFPDREGFVFPWSESSLKRWRAKVYKTANVPSLQDGARHSMATYYLALHTIEDTVELLGNSDKVLFRHYKGLVKGRKLKAKTYFNIRPSDGKGKIIPLPTARVA